MGEINQVNLTVRHLQGYLQSVGQTIGCLQIERMGAEITDIHVAFLRGVSASDGTEQNQQTNRLLIGGAGNSFLLGLC